MYQTSIKSFFSAIPLKTLRFGFVSQIPLASKAQCQSNLGRVFSRLANKHSWIIILAFVIFALGCSSDDNKDSQTTTVSGQLDNSASNVGDNGDASPAIVDLYDGKYTVVFVRGGIMAATSDFEIAQGNISGDLINVYGQTIVVAGTINAAGELDFGAIDVVAGDDAAIGATGSIDDKGNVLGDYKFGEDSGKFAGFRYEAADQAASSKLFDGLYRLRMVAQGQLVSSGFVSVESGAFSSLLSTNSGETFELNGMVKSNGTMVMNTSVGSFGNAMVGTGRIDADGFIHGSFFMKGVSGGIEGEVDQYMVLIKDAQSNIAMSLSSKSGFGLTIIKSEDSPIRPKQIIVRNSDQKMALINIDEAANPESVIFADAKAVFSNVSSGKADISIDYTSDSTNGSQEQHLSAVSLSQLSLPAKVASRSSAVYVDGWLNESTSLLGQTKTGIVSSLCTLEANNVAVAVNFCDQRLQTMADYGLFLLSKYQYQSDENLSRLGRVFTVSTDIGDPYFCALLEGDQPCANLDYSLASDVNDNMSDLIDSLFGLKEAAKESVVEKGEVPVIMLPENIFNMRRLDPPNLSQTGGSYEAAINISITTAVEDAKIYITTDGSRPNAQSGVLYSDGLEVTTSTTVKAIAVKDGYYDSDVVSASYYIANQATRPIINLDSGSYDHPQIVSLSSDIYAAKLFFSLDGQPVSENENDFYSAAFILSDSATLKALTAVEGWQSSTVAEVNIQISPRVSPVRFSVAGGDVIFPIKVGLSCATAGAEIRYTLDGQQPSQESAILYQGEITLTKDSRIAAIAYSQDQAKASNAVKVHYRFAQ